MFLLLSLKTPAGMSFLKKRWLEENFNKFFHAVFAKTNADKKRECFGNAFYCH